MRVAGIGNMIKVTVDSSAARRALAYGQKQARYAAAVALTRTAKHVQVELAARLKSSLPGAGPYTTTVKAQYVKPATVANLAARVGMKDQKPSRGTSPAMLVKEHFTGGRRGHKPMEVAMRAAGVLPAGWIVVPGAAMPIDRFGNPTRAAVAEIQGALKRGVAVVGRRGKTTVAKAYFVVTPGGSSRAAHLAPGIWRRINNRAIAPVFLFVSAGAAYRQRIDLRRIAEGVASRRFAAEFSNAYRQALATAR